MKTKHILAILTLALVAAFTFTGCESTDGGQSGGTHQMGSPKTGYTMPDSGMPGR